MRSWNRSTVMRATRPFTWQNDVRDDIAESSAASASTKLSLPTVPTSTLSPFKSVATTDSTASIGKSTWCSVVADGVRVLVCRKGHDLDVVLDALEVRRRQSVEHAVAGRELR